MKRTDKLKFIQDNYFHEWLTTRQKVDDELSAKQAMFCVCGRLATGLHESSCQRFKNAVVNETMKRLDNLLS